MHFLHNNIRLLLLPPATTISNVASEEFRNDSITVTLELMVESSVISIEPRALGILNLEPGRILLTLSYNTLYSVSTTATLCGQNASHFIELHYGKSMCNFLR